MEFEATTGNINDDWESFFQGGPWFCWKKRTKFLMKYPVGLSKWDW